MNVLLVSSIIFVLTVGAALGGLAAQRRLLDEHKSGDSRGVVGQVSGLVSLLLALVLGTLVGVSFSYFSTQKTELETLSVQVLRLDQALAQYGPETKPIRDKLKEYIISGHERYWGAGANSADTPTVEGPLASGASLIASLAALEPKTDTQKQALSTANTYAGMVEQSLLVIALQVASHPVSWILVVILVFWTLALFFAIGLYAPTNWLVIIALAFGALSISFAIFLILELGLPYTGLFRVSPAALEETIQYLDR